MKDNLVHKELDLEQKVFENGTVLIKNQDYCEDHEVPQIITQLKKSGHKKVLFLSEGTFDLFDNMVSFAESMKDDVDSISDITLYDCFTNESVKITFGFGHCMMGFEK